MRLLLSGDENLPPVQIPRVVMVQLCLNNCQLYN